MHGLEGNKIFAAILFGIFVVLGVVFVPRIIREMNHLVAFVMHPDQVHHERELCDADTGKHRIIPGFCLIPESPKPQAPVQPFLLQLVNADVEAAAGITTKTCGGCHVFTQETGAAKAGPNLWNVIGADIASKASYNSWSPALSNKDGNWTYEELNGFLTAPGAWVAGTKMSYAGQTDPAKRALYVAYLRSLSKDPVPLPSQSELDALQSEYDSALAQYEIDLAAWEAGE